MSWDDYAETWDQDPAVRAYAEAAFGSLQELLHRHDFALAGARALDFGCGTGLLAEELCAAGADVLAVDSSEKMIEALTRKVRARGLRRLRPLAATADAPLIQDAGPFDLVVCSSVCAFLDDYPGAVARLARELRAGGLFVQWDWALDPADEAPFGLTVEQMRGALTDAALEVLRVDVGFEVRIEDKTMAPLMGVGRRPPDSASVSSPRSE